MNVIKQFITSSALSWIEKERLDSNSIPGFIANHIYKAGKLRDAQSQSIFVYLWLKCYANNLNLSSLLEKHYSHSEGYPLQTVLLDLATELQSEKIAKFANQSTEKEIKTFFIQLLEIYNNIPNFLFSLPMGAGKTFVMASMIYIDSYFNLNSNDKRFAKNFLIFAPSGLKKSVIPSLRSIEHFDATWIFPNDIVEEIKKTLKFVVLDVKKNSKKSNRIENPNARKVHECINQPDPSGYIFVTNAEKVILENIIDDDYQGTLFEKTEQEKSKQANELRHLLGQVPNMSILIDEVHHTQKDENKLKLVITKQFNPENIISIVGFTGTPYFKRTLTIKNISLKLDQIPFTVYHYELKNGVKNFLKQPVIRSFNSNTETIVKSGLEEFYLKYWNSTYNDGRKPKIVIYCSNIERLEEEILPIVATFFQNKNLAHDQILKYYGASTSKSGKKYSLDKDAEIEFSKLDTPYSNKRVILLVQIGKEGWDCQSLTGVILSGEGDSPKNMVLQTSCRCLREVDDASKETGLIFLNGSNYKYLERELKDNHNITIEDFEEGRKEEPVLKRIDRRSFLKLPDLKFNQFMIEYELSESLQSMNTQERLLELNRLLLEKNETVFKPEIERTYEGFNLDNNADIVQEATTKLGDVLTFSDFILYILKSSFGTISYNELKKYRSQLLEIYNVITKNSKIIIGFSIPTILIKLHNAFIAESSLKITEKVTMNSVAWITNNINKNPISEAAKIYPDNLDFINKIEQYDKEKSNSEELLKSENEKIKQIETVKNTMSGDPTFITSLNEKIAIIEKSKLPIKNKDKSFHYIPYDFSQSKFERLILENIFMNKSFQEKNLEIYFNGDRFISTFKIKIYKNTKGRWRLIQDKYTPDFLVIQRNSKNKIVKSLIIETKGAHLAYNFSDIYEFMKSKFLELNKNNYSFLYLEDGKDIDYQIQKISEKIETYFS